MFGCMTKSTLARHAQMCRDALNNEAACGRVQRHVGCQRLVRINQRARFHTLWRILVHRRIVQGLTRQIGRVVTGAYLLGIQVLRLLDAFTH